MKVILQWTLPFWTRGAARQPDFHSPLPPGLRVAVLGARFREGKWVRVFAPEVTPALAAYAPQVVAAAASVLRALARGQKRSGGLLLPVECALVALTEADGAPLSQADRDLLWEAFGVPVYEQLIDVYGNTLATECEAHAGLHVRHAEGSLDSLAMQFEREVDESVCGCGRTGARLMPMTPAREPVRVRAKAVGAAA